MSTETIADTLATLGMKMQAIEENQRKILTMLAGVLAGETVKDSGVSYEVKIANRNRALAWEQERLAKKAGRKLIAKNTSSG